MSVLSHPLSLAEMDRLYAVGVVCACPGSSCAWCGPVVCEEPGGTSRDGQRAGETLPAGVTCARSAEREDVRHDGRAAGRRTTPAQGDGGPA